MLWSYVSYPDSETANLPACALCEYSLHSAWTHLRDAQAGKPTTSLPSVKKTHTKKKTRQNRHLKGERDSQQAPLTGTSRQQDTRAHLKKNMDSCFATLASLFLLFAAASCAPAGRSLQDACGDAKGSSMKLNQIAKNVSVEVSLFFVVWCCFN